MGTAGSWAGFARQWVEGDRALVTVALAAVSVRLAAVLALNIQPESDYAAYFEMARSLHEGRGLVDPFGNFAYYNAGYPLFLYGVFSLSGPSVAAAQAVNTALGAVSAVLVFLVGRRVGHSPAVGWLSALMWIGYVEAAVYAEYLAKENLVIPLLLGILYLSLRLPEAPRPALNAGGMGLLYAAQALTGSAALFALPITLMQIACLRRPLSDRFKLAIVLSLAMGVALAPWLYRNQERMGAPVLNTSGGFNLYLGNNPAATGYFVSIARTPLAEEWNRLRTERGELAANRRAAAEAFAYMSGHPWETVKLALYKGMVFWKPPFGESGREKISAMEDVVRNIWLAEFLLLGALALATFLRPALLTREAVILWLYVAGYTAVHMVFYVIFRYRLAIMPVVVVLAAHALWALVNGFRPGGCNHTLCRVAKTM